MHSIHSNFIDSVESPCRDRADMQYNYANDNLPFIFECFPGHEDSHCHQKNHRESTTHKSCQTSKNHFSDGLVQTPSRWFSHKTASFCTEQYTTPSLFSLTSKSHEPLETAHSITMASSATPFSSLFPFCCSAIPTSPYVLTLVLCIIIT